MKVSDVVLPAEETNVVKVSDAALQIELVCECESHCTCTLFIRAAKKILGTVTLQAVRV